MNAFSSECSSGCESGWTVYLEQSFLSPATVPHTAAAASGGGKKERTNAGFFDFEEEQEDDLSMLSDASSGPPHFNEDEIYPSTSGGRKANGGGGKRRRERKSGRSEKQEAVDDTASSPAFNLYKNDFGLANDNYPVSMESMVDYSQEFSATNFKERSAYKSHFYVQSSLSGNQLQNDQWY